MQVAATRHRRPTLPREALCDVLVELLVVAPEPLVDARVAKRRQVHILAPQEAVEVIDDQERDLENQSYSAISLPLLDSRNLRVIGGHS